MDTHETKIYTAILIAAGVIGIIITYFIVTVLRSQRRHMQLQQQYLLTEINTLEKERKRIVSDLHDELGPLISTVKLQVSSLEITQKEETELISKAGKNLDNILERVRGICNELMPQVLIRKGLVAAIEEFVNEINAQSSTKITFTNSGVSFQQSTEIHIYRIVQEMINNAVKHAHAGKIFIDISCRHGKQTITVADDGIGFDADKITRDTVGLGLKNILSRTQVLKGEMYIESAPGKGAKLTIEIPDKNGS